MTDAEDSAVEYIRAIQDESALRERQTVVEWLYEEEERLEALVADQANNENDFVHTNGMLDEITKVLELVPENVEKHRKMLYYKKNFL